MKTKRHRSELIGLAALLVILIGVPAGVLGYQFWLRPALAKPRTIDIVAAAPEAGGFQPDTIRLAARETVRLRFSAPDVTHGLALGPGLADLGQIDPGQVKEVELKFDQPGRYTFYCNTWCSPNHWRMRGVIEVYDPARPDDPPVNDAPDPIIESLAARQVNIDTPHQAAVFLTQPVSAARGATVTTWLGASLPANLTNPAWRRSHSPVEAQRLLAAIGLSDADAWDAVAYLWLSPLTPARREAAMSLYAKNCAACHGESGDGHGPNAAVLASQPTNQHSDTTMPRQPAAFANPQVMLGGSGEIYYAKLRRGGMGTSMPSFGPIFTPDETWLLVDYLWTFVFDPPARSQ